MIKCKFHQSWNLMLITRCVWENLSEVWPGPLQKSKMEGFELIVKRSLYFITTYIGGLLFCKKMCQNEVKLVSLNTKNTIWWILASSENRTNDINKARYFCFGILTKRLWIMNSMPHENLLMKVYLYP